MQFLTDHCYLFLSESLFTSFELALSNQFLDIFLDSFGFIRHFHPRVLLDLFDRGSLFWVIVQHPDDEVFEFIREILSASLPPVFSEVILINIFIVTLILFGLRKWEYAVDYNE